jgi:hypothetical protein
MVVTAVVVTDKLVTGVVKFGGTAPAPQPASTTPPIKNAPTALRTTGMPRLIRNLHSPTFDS